MQDQPQKKKQKKTVQAFSVQIFHCVSLVNPESSFLMAKEGLRWCKQSLDHKRLPIRRKMTRAAPHRSQTWLSGC